jgi:hypothetical protein
VLSPIATRNICSVEDTTCCRDILKAAVREQYGDVPLGQYRIRQVKPTELVLFGKEPAEIGASYEVESVQTDGKIGSVLAAIGAVSLSPADASDQVAGIILRDLQLSSDLAAQQRLTGLRELLIAPLPISSLDSSGGVSALAKEYLPYVGSTQQLLTTIQLQRKAANHQRRVFAIAQASGSGKTRLAYAIGKNDCFVILIRIVKQSTQDYVPSWKLLRDLTDQYRRLQKRMNPAQTADVAKHAMSAMRLLVCCYAEWVASVLEKLPIYPSVEAKFALRRVAALRCLRNGKGDEAVGILYKHAMAELFADSEFACMDGTLIRVPTCLLGDVDNRCSRVDARLKALLWEQAPVVFFFDEVQQLLKTAQVFYP